MRRMKKIPGFSFFRSGHVVPHVTNATLTQMKLKPHLSITAAATKDHPLYDKLARPDLPLSDHLMTVTDYRLIQGENKTLCLQPHLPGDPKDFDRSELISIASFNMLKKTNGRNSGFEGHNELKIERDTGQKPYDARVKLLAERLGNFVKKNKTIQLILLQEAPVKEGIEAFKQELQKHMPEDFKVGVIGSQWGVMVVANENTFPELTKNSSIQIETEGPLKDRCVSIHLEELSTRIDVLHAPHDNPEQAYHTIIRNSQNFICEQGLLEKPAFTMMVIGDFNAKISDIEHIPEQAIHDIVPTAANNPLKVEKLISTSEDGHHKLGGKTASVDHLISIVLHNKYPELLKEKIIEYKNKNPENPIVPILSR